MFYDDYIPEWFTVFDGITHNALGEILAISEDDALEIAAGEYPDSPATEMYAIANQSI